MVADLNSIVILGGTVKFSKLGSEHAVKYILPEIVETRKGYLDFIYKYFHTKGYESEVVASKDIEQDLEKLVVKLKVMLNIEDVKIISSLTQERIKEARDCYRIRALLYNKNFAILKKLFRDGTLDPNARDARGVSQLCHSPEKVIKLLLEAGANPNLADDAGFTPLFSAKDEKTIKLLVKYGANIDHKNNLLKVFADKNRKNWPRTKPIEESHHKFHPLSKFTK